MNKGQQRIIDDICSKLATCSPTVVYKVEDAKLGMKWVWITIEFFPKTGRLIDISVSRYVSICIGARGGITINITGYRQTRYEGRDARYALDPVLKEVVRDDAMILALLDKIATSATTVNHHNDQEAP